MIKSNNVIVANEIKVNFYLLLIAVAFGVAFFCIRYFTDKERRNLIDVKSSWKKIIAREDYSYTTYWSNPYKDRNSRTPQEIREEANYDKETFRLKDNLKNKTNHLTHCIEYARNPNYEFDTISKTVVECINEELKIIRQSCFKSSLRYALIFLVIVIALRYVLKLGKWVNKTAE